MPAPTHNQPEYSVSEISGALKRVVEDHFGYVRIRGEISGFKRAASGHLYLDLKDDKAVINGVMWKGTTTRLSFKPEDGLEVVCTGKITTYAGSSRYQIVIDQMEPAGAGALMALLEQRKKALAAEGLFDPARKKPLPFMPQVIGVVTSPTGAVIRDILHRLSERFPVHVIVWPVRVQGEDAADEIAAAIRGFDALPQKSPESRVQSSVEQKPRSGDRASLEPRPSGEQEASRGGKIIPRPDLLIVARGGGSIEDLWCFNEEMIVRAVAECSIPLISAVGHETDTTLIDYVSDKRAPTPTAAAEIAVPVREEWLFNLRQQALRMQQCISRLLQHRKERVEGLARGIPNPAQLLAFATQRLDDWSDRLSKSLPAFVTVKSHRLQLVASRLNAQQLLQHIAREKAQLVRIGDRLHPLITRRLQQDEQKLYAQQKLFDSLNYVNVLKRGYALVKSPDGALLPSRSATASHSTLHITFHDGDIVTHSSAPTKSKKKLADDQSSLF